MRGLSQGAPTLIWFCICIVCYLIVFPGVPNISLNHGLSGDNWAKGRAGVQAGLWSQSVTMGLAIGHCQLES